ncbi:MAG: hypothetical protein R3E68_05070 [Burkholderiaceae bacterium]
MSDRAVTVYCGLLLTLAAFSIDITPPFFAVIRDAFGASAARDHHAQHPVTGCRPVDLQVFLRPLRAAGSDRPAGSACTCWARWWRC